MDKEIPPRRKSNKDVRAEKEKAKKRAALKWAFWVFFGSFFITAALSVLSGEVLEDLSVIIAIVLLLLFIVLGIIFDAIGLAVATADIKPFNSMAARKVKNGKKAVWLVKNTERVTSICNDVISDIAGVVSGATGAAIATRLAVDFGGHFWFTLSLTSLVAALTVGGKAFCKFYAMKYSYNIVDFVSKALCVFSRKPKQ